MLKPKNMFVLTKLIYPKVLVGYDIVVIIPYVAIVTPMTELMTMRFYFTDGSSEPFDF